MYDIDDLCIWKRIEQDTNSTTFEIVKQTLSEGKYHPLKPCVECGGYNYDCKNYVIKREYEVMPDSN